MIFEGLARQKRPLAAGKDCRPPPSHKKLHRPFENGQWLPYVGLYLTNQITRPQDETA
jgi:hypothetical protein